MNMTHLAETTVSSGLNDEAEAEGFFLASILLDCLETLQERGIRTEALAQALDAL